MTVDKTVNYNAVLLEILVQLNTNDQPVVIGWNAVQQLPSGALDCLIRAGILSPASAAKSIECSACTHHCFMDVLIQSNGMGANHRAFIVCEEPEMQSQMGRIQIPLEQLSQWKTSFKQLAAVIAELLGFDKHIDYTPTQHSVRLGMLKGKTGRRWVSLFYQPLSLEVNGVKTQINELLFIENGKLMIDRPRIDGLLESSPLNTEKAYVSSTEKQTIRKLESKTKYQNWQDEYKLLQKKYPNKGKIWYSQKIAKSAIGQGNNSETIRKKLR